MSLAPPSSSHRHGTREGFASSSRSSPEGARKEGMSAEEPAAGKAPDALGETRPHEPPADAEFSDYQILLLRSDHPHGFLFDTKRDSMTSRVYVAGYRRDADGNAGQLELSGCPVGAELLSVNQIPINGTRARYMHCINLLKGNAITLQVRIYGDQPELDEDEQPQAEPAVPGPAAVFDDGEAAAAVASAPPAREERAAAGLADEEPEVEVVEVAQEPAPEEEQQQQQQQQQPRHSLPPIEGVPAAAAGAAPRTPPAAEQQAARVRRDSAAEAESRAGSVTDNLMAAMVTMLESLGQAGAAAAAEQAQGGGDSFLPFISKVLASPGFAHFVSRRCVPQYYQSFLPSCVGEYMAKFLPPDQVAGLVSYIKAQVDEAFFSTFRGSKNYTLHTAATVRDARTFTLQAALHKASPLLASEGCRAMTQQPVFYLTEGSAMHGTARRYVWDLYLTPESIHVVPLRAKGDTGAGVGGDAAGAAADAAGAEAFPSYCMDVEALERQIVADRKAGRMPCAVLATFGAEANHPYQCDNLAALRRVCDRHGVWLHVEGSSTLLSAAPHASPFVYSAFEYANSVVMEPMDWFGGAGALSFALVRSSKTHTHHQRHLLPPEVPLTVTEFTSLFTLWYHLVGVHRSPGQLEDAAAAAAAAAAAGQAAARPASARDTFFGTPVRHASADGVGAPPSPRSGRDSAPPAAVDLLHGRLRGDTMLSHYVAHNLELCRHFKSALTTSGAFNAVVGPGYEHPHVVLFQLTPPDSMALSLDEMNLTPNGFNKIVFSRLHYLYTLQHRGLPVPEYAARLGLGGTFEEDLDDEEFAQRAAFLPASVRRELTEARSAHSTPRRLPGGAGGGRRRHSHGGSAADLYRTPSSTRAAPLPVSQIIYDSRIGFLFHPLAHRSGLGSCSALNQLGGVDGELGGAGPQDSPLRSKLSRASVDTFLSLVANEIRFIERAAAGRAVFRRLVEGVSELRLVPHAQVPGTFCGVGAFRFVPAFPVPVEHANALNAHLANLLAERNPIFRGVVAADRLVCVVIQSSDRLTDRVEEDVAGLVRLVQEVADKMELPTEVAQGLADVVVRGIRDAEAELQRATDDEYTADALIRKIPLVGSLFNWIAPGAGAGKRRSQAFDIRGGRLGQPRFVEQQNSEQRLALPAEDDEEAGAGEGPAYDEDGEYYSDAE